MSFNVDFGRGSFKGINQRPLAIEGFGFLRPNIMQIARKAHRAGLNAVVLRSYSHLEGTDNSWEIYKGQIRKYGKQFHVLGNGIIAYIPDGDTQHPVYLIHGQGLKTDKGDIQVLFTDKQVGLRKPDFIDDFHYLFDKAKSSGRGVFITASKPYNWSLDVLTRVDAIEVWNGVDSNANNTRSQEIVSKLRKPGIIVSNSKCLYDLGRSYTSLALQLVHDYNPERFPEVIKRGIVTSTPAGVKRPSTLSKLISGLATVEVMLTRNKD